jgi:hypothetical protein
VRRFAVLALITLASISACGGGSGSGSLTPGGSNGNGNGNGGQVIASAGPNVATLVVDSGPTASNFVATNTPFVTVTICAPGTANCQTIDHIEVDTGSYGLRVISSVINTNLLTAMPVEMAGGGAIAECTIFGDGYSWGPMRTADLQIASEKASGLPVQVIGDPNFPTVPAACSNAGGTAENTVDQFGANGILGVGPFAQDCGTACAPPNGMTTPQFYYSCPNGGGACTATAVALAQQATNPVTAFMTDNNGVILELPSLPDAGAAMATGALVFGIGTQGNNALGSAIVLTTDQNGFISTVYKGMTYPDSYIDSGSNLFYFNDSSITSCPIGSGTNNNFFCPASELTLSAQNEGKNNSPSSVTFKVANAKTQFTNNAAFAAFNNIGAPALASQNQTFDFGLPFFFGRNVFTAIEGMNTAGGMGPYFAY